MNNVWAFDLGENCGYAFKHEKSPRKDAMESGTEVFRDSFHSGGGYRLLMFRRFLRLTLKNYVPELIVYEEVNPAAHKVGHTAYVWGAFYGVLAQFGEEYNIPYTGVPQATLKKHAVDFCKAQGDDLNKMKAGVKASGKSKVAPLAAAERMFGGLQIKDDNEADAVCLLDYALKNLI